MFIKKAILYVMFIISPIYAAPFSTLEEDYTPKYCLQLEAAYGKGLMAEGGTEAIEHLFDGISIENKRALEIGSGLGGTAFYLAEKYKLNVTGLDVNPWLIAESKRRTTDKLKDKVDFFLSSSNSGWPISEDHFDLVYSKGVLTHLETKDEIFQECHRILKKGGLLVINDWLSSDEKKWGKNIAKLVELEHLKLYPETEAGYMEQLKRNGFTISSVRDDSALYARFNREVVKRLQDPDNHAILLNSFNEDELQNAVIGYEATAEAMETGELRVLQFVVQKD